MASLVADNRRLAQGIIKRSIKVDGRPTSVSLETPFWDAAKDIARTQGLAVTDLVNGIAQARSPAANLSSAIRVYVIEHFRSRGTC